MKKWDKIIIGVLVVISFLPHLLLTSFAKKTYNTMYAVVLVDGEEYKKIPLTGQVGPKEYEVITEYGENILKVENERITVEYADCPDQICKELGYVHRPHESLVCLPNRLYVDIQGAEKTNEDVDIRGY